MAYLMEGLPAIIWDNIPRGTQISCPHIERSCTSAYVSDRRLGVSEMVAASAASIHFFTGNNIGPRGDLASRTLTIRLDVERPDPDNREFTHPNPGAWTNAATPATYTGFDTIWTFPEALVRRRIVREVSALCRAASPWRKLESGKLYKR